MGIFIALGLVAILGCLAAAGYFMLNGGGRQDEKNKRMANALGWRVGLSIALFLSILIAWKLGWIQPHGIQ